MQTKRVNCVFWEGEHCTCPQRTLGFMKRTCPIYEKLLLNRLKIKDCIWRTEDIR
jgi:hypothetical protein